MKGGYQIVNLKGIDYNSTGSAITVPGIFEQISRSAGKPTLIEGMVVDGTAFPAFYFPFTAGENMFGGSQVMNGVTYTIEVMKDDSVVIAQT